MRGCGFYAIEDDAEEGGFAAIHKSDGVADFWAAGGVLAGDENGVVGLVGDEGGIVKEAGRAGLFGQSSD